MTPPKPGSNAFPPLHPSNVPLAQRGTLQQRKAQERADAQKRSDTLRKQKAALAWKHALELQQLQGAAAARRFRPGGIVEPRGGSMGRR